MIRTFFIPTLAIAGMVLAAYTVVQGAKPPIPQPPVIEPPRSPYGAFVAGAGLIEASSQNIGVGSPVGAVVTKVFVTVGDSVEAGSPLFQLEDAPQKSELAYREASLAVANQKLAKLKAGTRPEQIPPSRARVAAAKADVNDMKAQLAKFEQVNDPRAVSADDLSRRRFAVETAEARLAAAEADLRLLESGTWAPDLAVAQSEVDQAAAQASIARTEIERRVVRAPVSGRVLQVNIRVGEFAQAGSLLQPLMMVGTVVPLHVRTDIDEHEAWRVKTGAPATAFIKGNKDITFPLRFVRFEPYVLPKRSLTGDSQERVDTRVLQVIFAFDPGSMPVFVGQQVDVYIEDGSQASTAAPKTEAAPH
jgi:multidrug resistance efflux pump